MLTNKMADTWITWFISCVIIATPSLGKPSHHLNLKNPPRKGREEYYYQVGKQIFGAMASVRSSQKSLKKFKNQSVTGNPNTETLEKVKSKSRGFFNAYNPTVEYIGYAGHPSDDYKEALKSRLDKKKKEMKINVMRVFYKTTSRKNAQEVEQSLIKFSRGKHASINRNEVSGGGGSEGKDDKHFYVYAAYHVGRKYQVRT